MISIEEPGADICNAVIARLKEFRSKLGPEYEAGLHVENVGHCLTIHIRDVEYLRPSLISIRGITDGNEPAEVIRRLDRLNLVFVAVKRLTV